MTIAPDRAVRHEVVACVVSNGVLSCLVRRSQRVASDRGLWHCVTGYRDPGVSARTAALRELEEELGLAVGDIAELRDGPRLTYVEGDDVWVVHTFRATTSRTVLELNWENDAYVWTAAPHERSGCVWWLRDVYDALGPVRHECDDTVSGSLQRQLLAEHHQM